MMEEHRFSVGEGIVQVAGIKDFREARMLLDEGVDQIGFPLRLPVHREDTSEEEAARIVGRLASAEPALLITYLCEAVAVLELCGKLGVQRVQIHSSISKGQIEKLRALGPSLIIIKSLVVRENNFPELCQCVEELQPYVDAFITDTFDPTTGACGATGRTHDWDVSRRLVQISPRPIILAGGLTPRNVRRAILEVRPAGVDVHTGVEGPTGRKDRRLVRAFVAEAKNAFALTSCRPGPMGSRFDP